MVSASRRKSKMPSSAANQSARAFSIVCVDQRAVVRGRAGRRRGRCDRPENAARRVRAPAAGCRRNSRGSSNGRWRCAPSRRVSTVNSLVSSVSSTRRLASFSTGSSFGGWLLICRQISSSGSSPLPSTSTCVIDVHPLIAGGAVNAGESAAASRARRGSSRSRCRTALASSPCASRISRRRRWKYCAGSRRPSIWSSRRPCSLPSAISLLDQAMRWPRTCRRPRRAGPPAS